MADKLKTFVVFFLNKQIGRVQAKDKDDALDRALKQTKPSVGTSYLYFNGDRFMYSDTYTLMEWFEENVRLIEAIE